MILETCSLTKVQSKLHIFFLYFTVNFTFFVCYVSYAAFNCLHLAVVTVIKTAKTCPNVTQKKGKTDSEIQVKINTLKPPDC